jgi:uncharacterized membrane protein YeaQ/YmgE (transglycosylase-associated protein family)
MNVVLWLVVGGVIGWIASILMGTNARQGALLNVVVGIVGALLAGLLLSPILGRATINQGDFSLSGLVVSLLGATLLLGIVHLLRRAAAR